MALIEWQDRFSVGVEAVDHEHRELITLINDWYDSVSSNVASDERMEILGETYARIAAHFALEEKLMRAHGYERYEPHKADHEKLLDQLRDIMDAAENTAPIDDTELSARLERWFSEHFRNEDAPLHGKLG